MINFLLFSLLIVSLISTYVHLTERNLRVSSRTCVRKVSYVDMEDNDEKWGDSDSDNFVPDDDNEESSDVESDQSDSSVSLIDTPTARGKCCCIF